MFNFACNYKLHPPPSPIERDDGYTASEVHRTAVVEVVM